MLTTVRSKTVLGLSVIGAFVALMAIISVMTNRDATQSFDVFMEARARISLVAEAETIVLKTSLHAMDALVAADKGDIPAADLEDLMNFDRTIRDVLPRALGAAAAAQGLADWSKLHGLIVNDLRAAIRSRNKAAFAGLDDQIDEASEKLRGKLDEYRDNLGKRFDAESAARTAELSSASIRLSVIALIAFLAVVGVGIGLEFLLLRPLRRSIDGLRRLAAGDVSVDAGDASRPDEIGDVDRALGVFIAAEREKRRLGEEQKLMLERTGAAARGVQTNAGQVAGAAMEASSAIGQIAKGVQQQVQALQQVGSAISQSVRAINEINSNAMNARDNAGALEKLSQEGLDRVAALTDVVARSAEASEQIRRITQVIDGISRKTNLLSLNAQIEAANAGEVGRGFAVVANEVQMLADNVARSAGEIAGSVEQIIADVRSITGSADAVGEIIVRFRESARGNADLMMSVSAAVEETEATVTEISASMEDIGSISRSNAASTEELSATMHDLASVADNMRKQVESIA